MKATLLLLGDPRMSGCFACKCPFVNWQRSSLTLRRCEFDLENVWGSLGECCWPSETPRRRAGAVEGEFGDPASASLILPTKSGQDEDDDDDDGANQAWSSWLFTCSPRSRRLSASCGSVGSRQRFSSSLFARSSHRWERKGKSLFSCPVSTWGRAARLGLRCRPRGMGPEQSQLCSIV